jgi:hypothetical protein
MQATVKIKFRWDNVFVWLLTLCTVVAYVGVRVYYLGTGKSTKMQSGVNIPYSWMALLAEGSLASLCIYLHQNFWKQTVDFTEIPSPAMDKIYKVLLHP